MFRRFFVGSQSMARCTKIERYPPVSRGAQVCNEDNVESGVLEVWTMAPYLVSPGKVAQLHLLPCFKRPHHSLRGEFIVLGWRASYFKVLLYLFYYDLPAEKPFQY